jgi:hypothetical protein
MRYLLPTAITTLAIYMMQHLIVAGVFDALARLGR